MSGQVYKRGPGFVCVFCNRHYNGTCNQYIHLRRHIQEKPYNCLYCDFTAVCGTDLNLHTQNKHVNMSVSCDLCNATFKTPRNLAAHLKRAHNGRSGDFKCDICDRAFSLSRTLNAHRKTHNGAMPYKCETCGKGFAQKGNYNQHQRSHRKEKRFGCDLCGRGFLTRQHRKMHEEKYAGNCQPKTKKGVPENVVVKKGAAKRKDLGFTPVLPKPGESLNLEMNRVNTAKNGGHTCDVCGRNFNLLGTLISHKRTHTGEKPFKCETCGKCFSQKGNYNQHQRGHRDDRRFECNVCGKKFLTKHLWRNHEQKCFVKKTGEPEAGEPGNGTMTNIPGMSIVPEVEKPVVVKPKGAAKRKDLGLGVRRMPTILAKSRLMGVGHPDQVVLVMPQSVTVGMLPVELQEKEITPNGTGVNVNAENNAEGIPVQVRVSVEGDQHVKVKTEEIPEVKVENTEFVLGF